MGRTTRHDLDYFPMDVYFDQDDKVKLLESEFGNQATTLYFKLLARIYREKGYWKKWDKDTEMLFASDINENYGYVREVIRGCLRRGLFNQSVFESFDVLTSAAIQSRYIDIVNQLGRSDVVIVSEYWVLDKPLSRFSRITPDVIHISSDEKDKTSGGNDLNKKESKKKKNKINSPPAREEVREYFSEKGYPVVLADKFYDYYQEPMEDRGGRVWKDQNGNTVNSWKQKAIAVWMKPERKSANNGNKIDIETLRRQLEQSK